MAHQHQHQHQHDHPDSSLFKAVDRGDIDAIRLLIATGTDVNSGWTSAAGVSPFQLAASHGRLDIVRLLIQHGHDSTRPYVNGHTQVEEATKNASDFAKIRDLLVATVEKKTRRHPKGPRPDTREPRARTQRPTADTSGPSEENQRHLGGPRPM